MTLSGLKSKTTLDVPAALVFARPTPDPGETQAAARVLGAKTVIEFDAADWFEYPASAKSSMVPIIALDASEGIGEIDRQFARLVAFLGLPAPIVFVDNLSLIGFDQEQFELVEEEFRDILAKMRLEPEGVLPLPMARSDLMPWWQGQVPSSISSRFAQGAPSQDPTPLRLTVTLSENDGHTWTVGGKLLSGGVAAGDEILSSPSNLRGQIQKLAQDDQGFSKLTFDRPYYIEPGEVISHVGGRLSKLMSFTSKPIGRAVLGKPEIAYVWKRLTVWLMAGFNPSNSASQVTPLRWDQTRALKQGTLWMSSCEPIA